MLWLSTRVRVWKIIYVFLLVFFYSFLYSVPHISGKYVKGQPKDKVKQLPDVSHLRKKAAPAIEIAKTLSTVGTKKVAVTIVDFEDQQFSPGWVDQVNLTFTKLKQYYSEVSYNKLNLEITFFYNGGSTGTLTGNETAYRMDYNMGYYGRDTEDSLAQLVKDALTAAGGAVKKPDYDYVMVLHAGYGNESTSNPSDIWSVYIDWNGPVYGFTDGTIVPEKEQGASPVGVVCHEFAHQLGLPDLYYNEDTGQKSVVGKWCLMDYGVWLSSPGSLQGSSPAHLSAWCKYFLGWIDVEVVSSTKKNVQLPYIESSSNVVRVPIITATDPDNEYFLLEYRKKTGFDIALPNSGLLIWRIDDNIASNPTRLKNNDINSGVPHYGVDLIEADGTSAGDNYGDAGDPFPGSEDKITFVPREYGVFAYNGNPINIIITNITQPNDVINFDIVSFSGLYVKITKLDRLTPLKDVKIYVYNNSTSTFTYSGNNGTAILELSSGSWTVEYSKENYQTVVENIIIDPEKILVKNIILRYEPSLVVSQNSFVIGNNYFDYTKMNTMLFRYHISEPQNVKIVVYDIAGNVVKTFDYQYHSVPGYYEQLWDVKNDRGEPLSSGLYFAVVKTGSYTKIEKFIIKRNK